MTQRPAMRTDVASASPAAATAPPWAALLEPGYRRLGLALPSMVRLPPDQLPSPYHGLLVHSDDMTPTLEAFYGDRLRLRALSRECSADTYRREVILELEKDGRPVEYGAIGVHLQNLPPAARGRVLEEQHPFGRILQTEGIAHLSWPQAFFAVRCDAHLSRLLGPTPDQVLYGRRNVLLDGHRRLLAEVVEIVAPTRAVVTAFSNPGPGRGPGVGRAVNGERRPEAPAPTGLSPGVTREPQRPHHVFDHSGRLTTPKPGAAAAGSPLLDDPQRTHDPNGHESPSF